MYDELHAIPTTEKEYYLYLIATMTRIHLTGKIQECPRGFRILSSLHLAVDYSCVLSLPIHMMNFSNVCRFL